jgi:predicted nucleotidyltransferase
MTTTSSSRPAELVPHGVQSLVAQLSAEPSVRRVILFGSRARGDAEARSDVDLAVEAPGASARDWLRLVDMAEDADTLLAIDLVRLEEAPSDLRQRIEAEGLALYER